MNLDIFKKLDDIEKGENKIVYIIKIQTVEGQLLYKIGVTTEGRHIDRLMEILKGYFTQYRYTPYAKLVRFRVFEDAYSIEHMLHDKYKTNNYKFDKKFCGSTEFFQIDDECKFIEDYDRVHSEPINCV